MILYGGFGSPFTRRVGTTLRLYGLDHEHVALRVGIPEQLERLKKLNPLGRVPALETEDGRVLIDSTTILDYLDRLVGPQKSLVPLEGDERTNVLNIIGVATGAVEKSVASYYEAGPNAKRPADKVHKPWLDNMYQQTKDGIEAIDRLAKEPWLTGEKITQADVSVVVFWDFIVKNRPVDAPPLNCPQLKKLSNRANSMSEFSVTIPQ